MKFNRTKVPSVSIMLNWERFRKGRQSFDLDFEGSLSSDVVSRHMAHIYGPIMSFAMDCDRMLDKKKIPEYEMVAYVLNSGRVYLDRIVSNRKHRDAKSRLEHTKDPSAFHAHYTIPLKQDYALRYDHHAYRSKHDDELFLITDSIHLLKFDGRTIVNQSRIIDQYVTISDSSVYHMNVLRYSCHYLAELNQYATHFKNNKKPHHYRLWCFDHWLIPSIST